MAQITSYLCVCICCCNPWAGISKLYSDGPGTRLVFVDEKSDGFLYYPVMDKLLEVPNFLPSTDGVLWEMWPSDKVVKK